MGFYKTERDKGKEVSITTEKGKEVKGNIAYEKRDSPGLAEVVVGIATCGLSLLAEPDDKTTIVDSKGNYWVGKRK